MEEQTVRDWIHPGLITCRPDTPVDQVAITIDEKDISALVVVDEADNAIGVISRTDLVNARFIQPYLKHWRGMSAEHLMSKPVISVSPDTRIKEAVAVLQERRIHRLAGFREDGGGGRPPGLPSADSNLTEPVLARYVADFTRRVTGPYQEGEGSAVLPADLGVAR